MSQKKVKLKTNELKIKFIHLLLTLPLSDKKMNSYLRYDDVFFSVCYQWGCGRGDKA